MEKSPWIAKVGPRSLNMVPSARHFASAFRPFSPSSAAMRRLMRCCCGTTEARSYDGESEAWTQPRLCWLNMDGETPSHTVVGKEYVIRISDGFFMLIFGWTWLKKVGWIWLNTRISGDSGSQKTLMVNMFSHFSPGKCGTLWQSNMAMENGSLISDFPINQHVLTDLRNLRWGCQTVNHDGFCFQEIPVARQFQ